MNRFRELEERLRRKHPEKIEEAERLAKSIVDPRNANADQVWLVLGDKPLYTNARADVAKRIWVAQFQRECADAWCWDNSAWDRIVADPRARGLTFSVDRLRRIRGAATALRGWDRRHPEAPLRDLADRLADIDQGGERDKRVSRLEEILLGLRKELGAGWGPATILHALTDLGLACKPDRHVLRTLGHLGLISEQGDNPTIRRAAEVVVVVRDLVRALDGDVTPRRLRYVDKILVEISARGLIGGGAAGAVDVSCRSDGTGGRPSGPNARGSGGRASPGAASSAG